MLPVITDDGVRLLVIIFQSKNFVMVADWSNVFTAYRRDMCCGIIDAKALIPRDEQLPAYVSRSA